MTLHPALEPLVQSLQVFSLPLEVGAEVDQLRLHCPHAPAPLAPAAALADALKPEQDLALHQLHLLQLNTPTPTRATAASSFSDRCALSASAAASCPRHFAVSPALSINCRASSSLWPSLALSSALTSLRRSSSSALRWASGGGSGGRARQF